LYNDDGVSFDYENGEFSLTELIVEKKKNGNWEGKSKILQKVILNTTKSTGIG